MGDYQFASTQDLLVDVVTDIRKVGIRNITTTVVEPSQQKKRKRSTNSELTALSLKAKIRKKREATTPIRRGLPEGCNYVFADGSRDARDNKELSIQQRFFELQESGIKDFIIKLNITKSVWDGRKFSHSYGTAYMNIFINDPPENGTCSIRLPEYDAQGKEVWVEADTGRSLIDKFQLSCRDWVDPNDHSIRKYVFKIVEKTPKGNQTTMLYSGTLDEITAVFPVGEFHLYAEIHEEAGAYAVYDINPKFPTTLPDQDDYEAVNIDAWLKAETALGNQARVAQILLADASIRKSACWFDLECQMKQKGLDLASLDPDKMNDREKEEYNELMRTITNANTEALQSAQQNLQFSNLDQLEQGASTLYSITSNLVGSGPLSKTLDMEGRNAAVDLIEKMSEGFKTISVPDPNKLKSFIESTTGAAMAVMDGLNSILYSNDPKEIPLTDFERAASMPYDTDIPEGEDPDIPEDPEEALRNNAMKLTRIRAIEQVKKMTSLIDEIGETTIMNSVLGEELRTKTPLGVQMTMTKLGGSNIVGRDLDFDGRPDKPLKYTFEASKTVIEFPLGFCPSEPGFVRDRNRLKDEPCEGQWGLVLKEWETITATYPGTAKRLNYVTKQIDIDLYGDGGGKIPVKEINGTITLTIERMKEKDETKVSISKDAPETQTVNVTDRLYVLKKREKQPIIYHNASVPHPFSTLNVQLEIEDPLNTKMVLLARFEKLPTVKACDFVKIVNEIEGSDEDYVDWYLGSPDIQSRSGPWYIGVAYLKIDENDNVTNYIQDMESCENSGMDSVTLDDTFAGMPFYKIRLYTAGMYFFDTVAEEWDGVGIEMLNTSKLVTSAQVNHLTSFATGFFPQPNHIDFEFIFAEASFQDNLTIFLLMIVSLLFYFIMMIWATCKDKKDAKAVSILS